MNKRKHCIIVFLSILICTLHVSSQTKTELAKLSKSSDVILIGKVLQQDSRWNESGSVILTDVTIQVHEYLSGDNSESEFIVTHLGGEVGESGEFYTHMPTFKNDEEVLLFIKKDIETATYRVLNGTEGKITILDDMDKPDKRTNSGRSIISLKEEIKLNLDTK